MQVASRDKNQQLTALVAAAAAAVFYNFRGSYLHILQWFFVLI